MVKTEYFGSVEQASVNLSTCHG